jgi:hypothetical protein
LRKSPLAQIRLQKYTRGSPTQPEFWVQVQQATHIANFQLRSEGCAGIAELMVFHPVDTTAKRLMSNIGKVLGCSL